MIPHWTPRRLPAFGRLALATTLLAASLGAMAPGALAADGPDLTLGIAASDTSIPLGDSVDFTFTMKNAGDLPVRSTRMEGSITGAQSLTITQQPSGQNACTSTGTDVTCAGLDLTAGLSVTLKVQARASSTTPGVIKATGEIAPKQNVGDIDNSNNSDTVHVTVFRKPDLTATVISGPDSVKSGADVHFKVKVQNLGGSASHIDLDFRSTGNLVYKSVDFVDDVKHGFSCDIHNPDFDDNYVSCSGGSLGDPSLSPDNDESVTVNIGATVKPRGLTSKDNSVTATVDPDHSIDESLESNNADRFPWHYD